MSRVDSPLLGRMVFLVGARRSGTNWLQHLLTLHPAMTSVPGETHLFSHGIAVLADRVQHGATTSAKTGSVYVDRDRFLDATREWCDAVFAPFLAAADGASLLLERTPLHAQHLDLIAAVYPDAHVVHLVRDGTAVALSLAAQEWGPGTVRDAAREWATTVSAAHASDVPLFREVRHEQLVADPATGVADLWQWLGLDVTDALRDEVAREASAPVNATAGKPGARTRALSARDAAAVVTEAGAELRRLGYPLPRHGRRALHAGSAVRRRWRRAQPSRQRAHPGGALWYERSQRLVDDLLTALNTDDPELLSRVTCADLHVQLNATSSSGAAARAALVSFAEPTRPVDTEVHAANPTFTVVMRPRDDTLASLVLVVTPDDDCIRRVVGYRLAAAGEN